MPRWNGLRLAAVACACSCVSPPLSTPEPAGTQQTPIFVAQTVKDKVDVLFLVDSSNSMAAMSDELKARFDQFVGRFDQIANEGKPIDLQIGVVTSDYGAGSTGAPGCTAAPGGLYGKLQAVGQAAAVGCKAPLGANYIHYNYKDGTNNLPVGQNVLQTFTCMASVGVMGCGFEHVLESVYAALHNNLPENAGFMRDGALLTVVFLTNEDDCSAPPVTDLFDRNRTAQYGYESSFRCTRFGLVYGGDPGTQIAYADSGGVLSNPRSAPNPGSAPDATGTGPGRLYDLSRYINYFTKPASQGGVKVNPRDVILVGIDAPADPVQVILSNPLTAGAMPYQPCAALNESTNPPCVPVLQHSCQNPQNPNFFGDPAVRVNTVINAATNRRLTSICDADYRDALGGLADLIIANIGAGCIPARLPTDTNGGYVADCVVQDVTQLADGTTSVSKIEECDNLANPAASTVKPCWYVEQNKTGCATASPQGIGITILRSDAPPPNTDASVVCATLP